jgi:hypothetical protein
LDAHGQRPKMPDAVDFRMRPASRAKGPVCHGMDPMGPSWVHGVGLAWNRANSPCLRMSVRFCYDFEIPVFYILCFFPSPSFSHIFLGCFWILAKLYDSFWINSFLIKQYIYPFDLNTVV